MIDIVDATDLAAMLRLVRVPEAWIAPPATRELHEFVQLPRQVSGR
jgi:hypothetical protein